jgi:hypothetical protein
MRATTPAGIVLVFCGVRQPLQEPCYHFRSSLDDMPKVGFNVFNTLGI